MCMCEIGVFVGALGLFYSEQWASLYSRNEQPWIVANLYGSLTMAMSNASVCTKARDLCVCVPVGSSLPGKNASIYGAYVYSLIEILEYSAKAQHKGDGLRELVVAVNRSFRECSTVVYVFTTLPCLGNPEKHDGIQHHHSEPTLTPMSQLNVDIDGLNSNLTPASPQVCTPFLFY